jgi:hypothetical protein
VRCTVGDATDAVQVDASGLAADPALVTIAGELLAIEAAKARGALVLLFPFSAWPTIA